MDYRSDYSNEELRKQQAEMAARVGFTWCEHKCEQEPLLAYLPMLSPEWNADRVADHRERLKRQGFEDMPHHAGLVKRCADCREKSPTFEWIADIPFEAFKQWMAMHENAFCLEDMKVLLPAGPTAARAFSDHVKAFYADGPDPLPEEKPKGGFEFL